MLVICEDCAKKYNIDESKIKGNRARFTCNECGHIIIVNKSDLSRPLVHTASTKQSPASSSIDLLKEMEAPLAPESHPQSTDPDPKQEDVKQEPEAAPKKEKKKLAIPTYFLIGGGIAFLLTNGGIGYILIQHHAAVTELLITLLVQLGAWAVSFGILFGIGMYLSRKVNKLAAAVNRISQGETDVHFPVNGPRELANLSSLLAALNGRVR